MAIQCLLCSLPTVGVSPDVPLGTCVALIHLRPSWENPSPGAQYLWTLEHGWRAAVTVFMLSPATGPGYTWWVGLQNPHLGQKRPASDCQAQCPCVSDEAWSALGRAEGQSGPLFTHPLYSQDLPYVAGRWVLGPEKCDPSRLARPDSSSSQ